MTNPTETFGVHNSAVMDAFRTIKAEAISHRSRGDIAKHDEYIAIAEGLYDAKKFMYNLALNATPVMVSA